MWGPGRTDAARIRSAWPWQLHGLSSRLGEVSSAMASKQPMLHLAARQAGTMSSTPRHAEAKSVNCSFTCECDDLAIRAAVSANPKRSVSLSLRRAAGCQSEPGPQSRKTPLQAWSSVLSLWLKRRMFTKYAS
jgi:hypothetical protein